MTKSAEESTPTTQATPLLAAPRFYIVSKNKFIVMFLLTLGYYYTYWLYKNWKTYRIATNARVLPLIRTIMGVLFTYSLHMKIDRQLYISHTHYKWHPRLLAFALIVSEFVGIMPHSGRAHLELIQPFQQQHCFLTCSAYFGFSQPLTIWKMIR
ncbi:hypothetical protein J3P88_03970 [Pseudomonas sp. Z3-6]|uniref:hypothetical protein n=1 Tax=Pseudomonas sp. Z3-6 TaxID=2817411 RepID=UPI003DA858AF